jgi:hypothetical protein
VARVADVQAEEFVVLPDVGADVQDAVDTEQVEQILEVAALIQATKPPASDDGIAEPIGRRLNRRGQQLLQTQPNSLAAVGGAASLRFRMRSAV